MLFTMEQGLEIGSSIAFKMNMPGGILGSPTDVVVNCTGRVVRKEGNGKSAKGKKSKNGVACVIDQYKFIRGKGTK